jgi:acetoin utilization deacetylase AcuC-like enzyme
LELHDLRQVRNAYALVRPPGHHAERATPMGFCFVNNVAVAAAHALDVYGLERVAIVDWDVHHGRRLRVRGVLRKRYDEVGIS